MTRRLKRAIAGGTLGSIVLMLGLRAAHHPNVIGAQSLAPEQENAPMMTDAPTVGASSAGQLAQHTRKAGRAMNHSPTGSSVTPAARALDDYLAWAKYPPSSRPAHEHGDVMRQHQRVPSWRRLDPEHHGRVMIRQSQDALYLAPGETSVVTLAAAVGSKRERLRVLQTHLAGMETITETPQPSAARVAFRDDGVKPDRIADDGEFAAEVHAPIRSNQNFKGTLRLAVELAAANETGSVGFAFVCTGDPPARFTGVVREQLEVGSLSLYVGVEILRPGRYVIQGRLDDARQRPIALLRFNDSLDATQREVRLVAFGKLLRDSGAISPFVLRDVQAWRLRENANPDREIVLPWYAHYATQPYPLSAMSDREWDSTSKTRHIEGLQRILAAQ